MFGSGAVRPADLLFFCRASGGSAFEAAVLDASTSRSDVFHVALLLGPDRLVHALPERGVVSESVAEALSALKPDFCELARLDGAQTAEAEQWAARAADWAQSQVGQAAYNDLFSADCLNSAGQRAFYCCQLVVHSFVNTSPARETPFLAHRLNFKDAQGRIPAFWTDYYRERGQSRVPQDEPGSHPSVLRRSPAVRVLAVRPARMSSSKLSIPRTFLKNLHFVGGAYANEGSSTQRFKVLEPRSGKFSPFSRLIICSGFRRTAHRDRLCHGTRH